MATTTDLPIMLREALGLFEHSCERLLAKLSVLAHLGEDDRDAVREMCRNVRRVEAKQTIIPEGERADHVHVVLDGWAAREKFLKDGSRQITAFLLPGDTSDLHVPILGAMDHSIVALTRVAVALVPHGLIEALATERPRIRRAFWWATLADAAVLRAWIVNIGRRAARARIAHLFCELHARLKLVGLVEEDRFDLPLTQEVLADALGLTSVHVNRVLQTLRGEELIRFCQGSLTILDADRMAQIAGYEPSYLHRARHADP